MPRRGRDHADGRDDIADGSDGPLVNRQLETALLREYITAAARARRGQAVLLLGVSGVGKSRLASLAASMAGEVNLPVMAAQCVVLGDWQQVQDLVDLLPPDDGRVRLLRSALRFVQGDFDAAAAEAGAALDSDRVDQVEVLIRLADIELHVGDLTDAAVRGQQALVQARHAGSVNQQARCLGILGATAFFAGEIDDGERSFTQALELVSRQSDDQRDRTIQATLLGNLANVAEARQDWRRAETLHDEATRLRRAVADARGTLHSLHGLGRTRIRLGQTEAGLALIDEAEQLALDLDEPLERAKIAHTRGDLRLEAGECVAAQALTSAALDTFVRSRTTYDIAHARLSLSEAAHSCGQVRAGVLHGSRARGAIERHGFGLLRHLRPGSAFPWFEPIAAALTAYVCGDALGLPWEGRPPHEAAIAEIEALPARPGWPQGSTSDDTALTLLVAEHLVARGEEASAEAFMATVVAAPVIPGIGPSTSAAIESYQQTGRLPAKGGNTNGAAMRALPVGWMFAPEESDRRRSLTRELSRATHPGIDAQLAACIVAACGAWAVDGAPPNLLLEVALEEQEAMAAVLGTGPENREVLQSVADGTWRPAPEGTSLDPVETVAASLACVRDATSLADGLHRAVAIGGDTDTVAALVGGLLGASRRPSAVLEELTWHSSARLPDLATIERLARGLANRRAEVA